jgi:DNA polymerase-3 subunit epsilon
MRQIVLDTETTGLEPEEGHRIIEIGCVEIVSRRLTGNHYHQYLQPDREIDAGAGEVHGITAEFLADKPRFADVLPDFLEYIRDSELIIHNAAFDVGFINHELRLYDPAHSALERFCTITDTLQLARRMHPGQRNSLDALCKRYSIDNTQRTLHGALLDAEILADVYLAMTGGQVALELGAGSAAESRPQNRRQQRQDLDVDLVVHQADAGELAEHEALLAHIRESGGRCLWDDLDVGQSTADGPEKTAE